MGDVTKEIQRKMCPKCQTYKEISAENYYFQKSGRPSSYCVSCAKNARIVQREANKNGVKIVPKHKYCAKCKKVKGVNHFASNITNKDGLSDRCFECRQSYLAEYYRGGAKPIQSRHKKGLPPEEFHYGPRKGFVYIAQLDYFFKIGISVNCEKRIAAINRMTPYDVRPVLLHKVEDMRLAESILHETFKDKCLENKKEWFRLSDHDLETAKEILNDL